jgi:NAD(P)-dependent dehydrogenase (short-subunit alcohol dehydrogenase family)
MAQEIKPNWSEADIANQSGKTIFITGANIGLGFEATRMLSAKGARVIMACRSEARANDARRAILAINPKAQLDIVSLDLGDLESASAMPAKLADIGVKKIDVLINNAGIMMPPKRQVTKQNFEAQFGTNHLGHFALTRTLFPLLAANGRIVNVASIADRRGDINWEDIGWEKTYSPAAAYGQSKTANLLFTKGLSERLAAAGSKIVALAAHPGISQTNLAANSILKNWLWLVMPLLKMGLGPKTQSAAMGALPEVYAATAEVEAGAYYGPSERTRGYPIRAEAHRAAHSDSAEAAQKLWEISEVLTGSEFVIK